MGRFVTINPLVLPLGYKELRKPKHINRRQGGGTLNAFDLAQFDYRTVFYDVFINRDCSNLIAIGPPFLNLEKFLGNLQLTVDGRKTKYRNTRLPRDLVQLQAGLEMPAKKFYDISISFEGYSWSRKIAPCAPEKACALGLTTIQKDNRIHWLLDWIKHYENELGVEQFVIYDNESGYQQELVDYLPDNVLVLPWNFPYGTTQNHKNKFLHLAQLNHARLRFEHIDTFLNFDVDELLMIVDEKVKSLIRNSPCVLFDYYLVPYVETNNANYSFSDFKMRDYKPLRSSKKYSFNRKKVSANALHKVEFSQAEAKSNPSKFIKKADIADAYFLHYVAINTDWKFKTQGFAIGSRLKPSRLKPYRRWKSWPLLKRFFFKNISSIE